MFFRIIMLMFWIGLVSYGELDSRVYVRTNVRGDGEARIWGGRELDFGGVTAGEVEVIEADTFDRRKVELRLEGNGSGRVSIDFSNDIPLYNSEGNVILYTPDIRERNRDNSSIPNGTSFYFDGDEPLVFYIGGRIDSYTTSKGGVYTGDLEIEIRFEE